MRHEQQDHGQSVSADRQDDSDFLGAQSDALSDAIARHLQLTYEPLNRKSLRMFQTPEAAAILGIQPGYFRTLQSDGKIESPHRSEGNRRVYSLDDINSIRDQLESRARSKGFYKRGRSENGGDKLSVICTASFKGGSGKSTTAIHIISSLAFRGYKVLSIDLDPQSSLTSIMGYQSEYDFRDSGTIYDALRYDDPVTISSILQPTCFPNVSIAPAGLILSEFDHETPMALRNNIEPAFHSRLATALADVESDFDVVIIDTPPALSFLTLSAMSASNGIIMPVVPNMLDIASFSMFLRMTSDLLKSIEKAQNIKVNFDFIRVLISRHEPQSSAQQETVGFIRSLLKDMVMESTVLKSSVIADASMENKTVHEVYPRDYHRDTYKRARDSVDAAMDEIEFLVQTKCWGREWGDRT